MLKIKWFYDYKKTTNKTFYKDILIIKNPVWNAVRCICLYIQSGDWTSCANLLHRPWKWLHRNQYVTLKEKALRWLKKKKLWSQSWAIVIFSSYFVVQSCNLVPDSKFVYPLSMQNIILDIIISLYKKRDTYKVSKYSKIQIEILKLRFHYSILQNNSRISNSGSNFLVL